MIALKILAAAVLSYGMARIARRAGDGTWPGNAAEALFGLPIGIACGLAHGLWMGLLGWVWAWAWFQSGHGTAFHMGTRPAAAQGARKEKLSLVIDPLCAVLGKPLGEPFYCWSFMGLKGLLIHLPLGLWCLPAAALWPACYHFGAIIVPGLKDDIDGEAVAEHMTGIASGFLIIFSIAF